jgi:hypothetical protein
VGGLDLIAEFLQSRYCIQAGSQRKRLAVVSRVVNPVDMHLARAKRMVLEVNRQNTYFLA